MPLFSFQFNFQLASVHAVYLPNGRWCTLFLDEIGMLLLDMQVK
ncbi:hypothetical protein I33_2720 [Bacillus subtilis subsp. subtilis str. RO-NN-1]|nr:hypothetical protein I33_2720 [Bacillus subtilis subsp. subtilis str. RO-NN-1]